MRKEYTSETYKIFDNAQMRKYRIAIRTRNLKMFLQLDKEIHELHGNDIQCPVCNLFYCFVKSIEGVVVSGKNSKNRKYTNWCFRSY